MTKTSVYEHILELAKKKKNTIAVGVLHDYPVTLESLKRASEYANIIVVGPKEVEGYEYVEGGAKELVELGKEGKADAIFRGNFDAVDLYDTIAEVLDFEESHVSVAPIVVKNINSISENINKLISGIPASPSNDKNTASKIKAIDGNIAFFESFGVKPKIGLLSAGKPTDILEGIPEVDYTLMQAEFLVNWYTNKGYEAKHFNHQSEYAIGESDIVVYPNSIAGNQAVRGLSFYGDNINMGAVSINMPFPYGQTMEAFRDWEACIMFLNAYVNREG